MKVIEELWYGNLKMCEREVPKDSPLRKSMNQASKAEEKLTETLNEEQLKMLETLLDKHLTLTADLECDAFTTAIASCSVSGASGCNSSPGKVPRVSSN